MTVRKPLFVVPLNPGTVTSGNDIGGHRAAMLGRHDAIGLTWRSSGNSNLWARGDLGTAQAIDFCALVSANAIPATTYRLRLGDTQAEVDGTADYDSGSQTFISPSITRADGLYHSFLELPSTFTKRWWRIDIGNHTGDFEASNLVLGKGMSPSRFYNFDHVDGVEPLGGLEFTRQGVPNKEPGLIFRTKEFTLDWQTEAEYEASFRPMIEALGKTGIVYLCFDPESSTYRQAKTYMGIMKKPPFARGRRKPTLRSQDFSILSMI